MVKKGFIMTEPIQLQLKDVTIMQIVDVLDNVTEEQKTCGFNRIFAAPEIDLSSSTQTVTEKADVWSIGAILYILNTGQVMQRSE